MKQFLYSILLMAGIALLLASCADDPLLDISEGNGNGGGSGDHLSLTMNLPLSTRATGVNKGSNTEIMINGIRLVFYKGNIVEHCWDLDIQLNVNESNAINVTGSDLRNPWQEIDDNIIIQTKAKELAPDNYKMLIIINPNSTIKGLTLEGRLISDIEDGIFDATVTTNMYQTVNGEPAYFLMLNHQGLTPINKSDFYSTPANAEDNPVRVSVERATAKLSCEHTGPTLGSRSTAVTPFGRFVMLLDYNNQLEAPWGMDYDIPEDCLNCWVKGCDGQFNRATKKCSKHPQIHTYDGLGLVADKVRYMVVTDLTWQVDIVNKKSFWMRKLTNKADGSAEKQNDNNREYFYAEDPNFFTRTPELVLTNEFTYLTATTFNSTAQKLLPSSSYQYVNYWTWDVADTKPIYVPENTMVQDEQRGDVVTRAIFRAVLKREKFKDINTYNTVEETIELDNPTLDNIGDFYVFKGGDTNIENYKYNNFNRDNSTFFILRPEDVAIYATAVKDGKFDENNVHIYLRTGMKAAIEKFIVDNPNFDFSDWENESPAISDELSFYKNGEIFYQVPIEHFSASDVGAGGYGRFGVVRNNWYKLNVENIISIGEPTIPKPTSDIIKDPASANPGGETRSATNTNSQFRSQSIIF